MNRSIHEEELSSISMLRAPLKPDISCGVIGLSQILMNRAVTELLLKKKKKNAATGFQESDSLLSTNCKVQRRTI